MMRGEGWLLGVLVLSACTRPSSAPHAAGPESGSDAGVHAASPETGAAVKTSTAIRYEVRVPRPATHDIEVRAIFPVQGRDRLTVMMPVWTPGSYLVREFARFVEGLSATTPQGASLNVTKVNKNRFLIETEGASHVVLTYRLYARVASVQGNFVDPEYGVFNGAGTFLTDVNGMAGPHEVQVELPDEWPELVTSLPPHPSGEAHRFLAPNYDVLVDAPLVAGKPDIRTFTVDGAEHVLAHFGDVSFWPLDQSFKDVTQLTKTVIDFWGEPPPYRRYVYLNVINEAGGGLEHQFSTLMMASRFRASTPEGYRGWLGLVSHEFFHTWNGKRLRPKALGPFDYEHETFVEDLWVVEGLTSYYDDLLLCRAGLMNEKQYLAALSRQIHRLDATPGRHVQSLGMSSHDTWIKFYRSHENSRNTTISYYNKGAIAGFVLDAAIRRATGGHKNLDDVMRLAYQNYAGAVGYTSSDWMGLLERVGGKTVLAEAHRLVYTTEPIDYEEALSWYGLRFAKDTPPDPDDADAVLAHDRKQSWLGVDVTDRGGRLVLTRVVSGGPAEQAGLMVDDEIVFIDDIRVQPGGLAKRLSQHVLGDEIDLTIARRGRRRSLTVVVGKRPRKRTIEIDPNASGTAALQRNAWLNSQN